MPSTYEPIATQTLGSAVSTVTLSSIPSIYTDLFLTINAISVSGIQNTNIRFNSDTTTNYSRTLLFGTGSSASSATASLQSSINTGFYTTTGSLNNVQIMNYANTTTFKTVLARSGDAADSVAASVGLWRKTPEAITSITIAGTGNYAIGSVFTLYGIKAA